MSVHDQHLPGSERFTRSNALAVLRARKYKTNSALRRRRSTEWTWRVKRRVLTNDKRLKRNLHGADVRRVTSSPIEDPTPPGRFRTNHYTKTTQFQTTYRLIPRSRRVTAATKNRSKTYSSTFLKLYCTRLPRENSVESSLSRISRACFYHTFKIK